jgi:hypothetical protein
MQPRFTLWYITGRSLEVHIEGTFSNMDSNMEGIEPNYQQEAAQQGGNRAVPLHNQVTQQGLDHSAAARIESRLASVDEHLVKLMNQVKTLGLGQQHVDPRGSFDNASTRSELSMNKF